MEEFEDALIRTLGAHGEGVLIGDATGVRWVNDALCEITGYTNAELTTLPSLLALVSPDEREANAERLRRRMQGERVPEHYQTTIVRKDGTRMLLEVAIRAVQSEAGPRIVAVVRPKD